MKTRAIKWVSIMLSLIFLLGIAGCTAEKPAATQAEPQEDKKVTIKFFSNLPDRAAGQGKLEQMLIDNYIKENPNVTIELEALQDEPYKQKFKAYASGNSIPDIYMVWGQPSFFNPVMEAGYAAELNAADFADYEFFNGALDGFSLNGKLYGLPRNTDYMVLYYNKALFESNGVKVPETFEEVITAAKAFRAKGIAPIAMNGKDKWAIALLYQDLVIKEGGDQKLIYDAISGKVKFVENPVLKKAAEDLKALMDVKGFQDSFVAADYGAANNLFAQEKAAMYYMGAWEVGMDSNPNFSDSFKKNVDAVKFPGPGTGAGKATDLLAWNGGGYAVSANSPVKDEAIKLLKYIMKPENWAKNGWQQGLVVPGQKYDSYLTGNETNLQKKLTEVLSSTTSISGTSWNDSVTPDFKTSSESLSQELAAGMLTPEEFLAELDKAVADALAK
ncbi:MAG TPA: extracellular solute-binding protein [Clostridia bacterium]|nr:extracellular solute-binding protein [Clostridia bacterium]